MPVGLVAIGSGTGLIALPYEMFELARRAPILFPTHMLSSALALLLAPVVIIVRQRPKLHRPLGRLLGGFVVIGGLTALPVAIMSHSTPWARAGFFVQGARLALPIGSRLCRDPRAQHSSPRPIDDRDGRRDHRRRLVPPDDGNGDCAEPAVRTGLRAVRLDRLDGAAGFGAC